LNLSHEFAILNLEIKIILTEKNHWPGIAIRVITVIPYEVTTHDGSHAYSYCNTNTTVGKFL